MIQGEPVAPPVRSLGTARRGASGRTGISAEIIGNQGVFALNLLTYHGSFAADRAPAAAKRRSIGMKINRSASAAWSGGLKDGKGTISTQSGALNAQPYGFKTRFEDQPGTNPEELIGAAHAGCFTMALSLILGEAGLTAERLETHAVVTLEQLDGGFTITKVALTLKGKVPGTDAETFKSLADTAKANCPVSKLLKAETTLDTEFLA
jgi:osmotically inducible protein OsmC